MRDDEKREYLERWGNKCFICEAIVEGDDRFLVDSIVPLTRHPDHADPEIIHTYMACRICYEEKELA